MSTRWDYGDEGAVPIAWWKAIGIVLTISGILPIAVAQLVWFVVTGNPMGGS